VKTAGIVIVVIIVCICGFLGYFGVFSPVPIQQQEIGPFVLVCEKHMGNYQNVGPVMDRLYKRLKDEDSIESTRGFGIYYDNPREVAAEKLRSVVGCILDGVDESTVESLKQKYTLARYPASGCVVARFPFKANFSIFVGVFKVYPKLIRYLQDNNLSMVPMMEIYDIPGRQIQYVAATGADPRFFQSLLELTD